eukprot:3287618-Pleurochrysis_carterae.AAC.1
MRQLFRKRAWLHLCGRPLCARGSPMGAYVPEWYMRSYCVPIVYPSVEPPKQPRACALWFFHWCHVRERCDWSLYDVSTDEIGRNRGGRLVSL